MKLQSIELHNFLSHEDTRWEPNGARLATIVGPNGAGKSSLLDGVLYALYDGARARTDQLVRLGATDMSAAVTFEFAGATYRVVRGRTTKSGGRSYLEVHVRQDDGSWRPLTGDDIRSTQAAIEELLRLDAATFTTAAFLRQGEADAFIAATAAERKRLLSTVLGLDVYARAEARARELARDLEARTAAERGQLERLTDAIAVFADVDEVLEEARRGLAAVEDELASQRSARNEIEERIRELDAQLAAADALAGEVERLRTEKAGLGSEWQAAAARKRASEAAIAEAERTVAGAADVDAAASRLPELRAERDRLVALEADDRTARLALEQKRRAVDELRAPYERARTAWETSLAAAQARVERLEGQAKAGVLTCETCGQPIGRDEMVRQLDEARAAVKALVEPKAPTGLAVEEAQVTRLESRIREIAFDAAALSAIHRELGEVERTAARGEAIAGARATLEREQQAVAAADADLARISERGTALKARIDELEAKAAETAELREHARSERMTLAYVEEVIEKLERDQRDGVARIATLEANVARRDELQGQLEAIAAGLATADVELGRLRRLVTAFGVTGIPARIIEGVLPELARYANELLAELRPGMTLELRAQRAKKDGKGLVEALDLVVRDDVGERPLALFSGGERMSVSLALAVGLSRLVARRAGTAIRTFVIDEPDGLDAEARRAFGQALRILAHHGELERVVVVSHHQDLADVGDAVYQVTKNGHGSVVEQIA